MTRFSKLLLVSACLYPTVAGPLAAGVNGWTASGPHGGAALALALAPSSPAVLYANSDGLLWRSDDRGETWQKVGPLFPREFVTVLAVDPRNPERLYANPSSTGLALSPDGGLTWRILPFHGTMDIRSLVIDPSDPGRIYAASPFRRDDGVSVYRSLDGGQSWRPASAGLQRSGQGVYDLEIDPRNPSTLWAASGGVWRSLDGGGSWQEQSDGLDEGIFIEAIAVDRIENRTLYAAAGDGRGLWRSVDGGGSWQRTRLVRDLVDVAVEPGGEVYVLTGFGEVLRSKDGGDSWAVVAENNLSDRLLVDPVRPGIVYATFLGDPESGFGGGVLRTTNGGDSWRKVGLPAPIYDVAVPPGASGTVYAAGRDGFFKSTDGGRSWPKIREVLQTQNGPYEWFEEVEVDPVEPGVVYTTAGYLRPEVLKSTDGGATWKALGLGGSETYFYGLEVDPVRSGTVYALTVTYAQEATLHRVFKTTDGGSTWDAFKTPRSMTTLLVDSSSPDVLYGGGEGIFRSDDAAQSWRDLSAVLPAADGPPSVRILAAGQGAVFANVGGGLYRSVDGAQSWQLLNDTLVVWHLRRDPADPDVLYAGGDFQGVRRSLDGGAHWHRFGDAGRPWTFSTAGPLAIDPSQPDTLYAATDSGVFALTHEACVPDATTLCIDDEPGDRRFRVRMSFDTEIGGGASGEAGVTPLAPLGFTDGGVLSFFGPKNPEVLVKVLDGCRANGSFWVFAAAATSVGYELVVEDTLAARRKSYVNPDHRAAATVTDTAAFDACDVVQRASRPVPEPAARPVLGTALGPCLGDATTLCLGDGRFRVRLTFDTAQGGGRRGDAAVTPLAPLGLADGGVMAFFSPSNPEVLVKVLDGCSTNGRFWVFAAAATNVGFELVVEDLVAGEIRRYFNPDGRAAETITDVDALATCPF